MTNNRGKIFLVFERGGLVEEEVGSLIENIQQCLADEASSGEVEISTIGRYELDDLLEKGELPNSIVFFSSHMAADAERIKVRYPRMNVVVVAGKIPASKVAYVPLAVLKAKGLIPILSP